MVNDSYTNEEYLLLVSRAPSFNVFNSIYGMATGKVRIAEKYSNIQSFVRIKFPLIYEVIYVVPISLMPLAINHKSSIVRAIAMWRLEVGK